MSHEKEPGLLGEMGEFRCGVGVRLEHLFILENKDATEAHWVHVDRSQEEAPNGQN